MPSESQCDLFHPDRHGDGTYRENDRDCRCACLARTRYKGPKRNGSCREALAPGARSAKTEPLYQRTVAIRKQALGPEHPDVANSLNNLAGLHDNQGQYVKTELTSNGKGRKITWNTRS
jgi:hypothetical protein